MERRDMLKGIALTAVTATAAGTVQAQMKPESVGVVDATIISAPGSTKNRVRLKLYAGLLRMRSGSRPGDA